MALSFKYLSYIVAQKIIKFLRIAPLSICCVLDDSGVSLVHRIISEHDPDIAKAQEWLGHADFTTTLVYDYRKMQPEDDLTFKAVYRVARQSV